MSESLGGRDSLRLTTRFRIRSAGATCSSYLAPSWVGASGLDMIQSGHHPKDWLSGGIPYAVNQVNWSAFLFNTRFSSYAVFFPGLSTTVVLTRYASYYYFFLHCWIGKGSWASSQRRLGREDALDSARHVSTTVMVPCVKCVGILTAVATTADVLARLCPWYHGHLDVKCVSDTEFQKILLEFETIQ